MLGDIAEFRNTNKIKFQAFGQLLHVILIAQKNIKPFLEDILQLIYKNLFTFDEPEFIGIVRKS